MPSPRQPPPSGSLPVMSPGSSRGLAAVSAPTGAGTSRQPLPYIIFTHTHPSGIRSRKPVHVLQQDLMKNADQAACPGSFVLSAPRHFGQRLVGEDEVDPPRLQVVDVRTGRAPLAPPQDVLEVFDGERVVDGPDRESSHELPFHSVRHEVVGHQAVSPIY